uniref:Uncharacterized protein n=1 Tax=Glossina pallidipes TaxID=7398 RepID=A0A1B0A386_GLOPL
MDSLLTGLKGIFHIIQLNILFINAPTHSTEQIGYILTFAGHRYGVKPMRQLLYWIAIIAYGIVEKLFHILQPIQATLLHTSLVFAFKGATICVPVDVIITGSLVSKL